MNLIICSLYDCMAGHTTFDLYKSEDIAKRSFESVCKHTDLIKDNPDMFALYKIGTLDKETGIIETTGYPIVLKEAKEVLSND